MKTWKKNLLIVIACVMLAMILGGCTEQHLVNQWGGTMEIDLPAGEHLVEITWKADDNLWYLTRPFTDGEEPMDYKSQENSSWGVWEGTVIIHEHR